MSFLFRIILLNILSLICALNNDQINARGGFGASIHIGSGGHGHWGGHHGGWGWRRPYYSDPYYYDDGLGFATGAIIGGVTGAAIASSSRLEEDPKVAFERKQKQQAISEHSSVKRKIEKKERELSNLKKKIKKLEKRLLRANDSKKKSLEVEIGEKKTLVKDLDQKIKKWNGDLKLLAEKIRNDGYDDTEDDDDDDDT